MANDLLEENVLAPTNEEEEQRKREEEERLRLEEEEKQRLLEEERKRLEEEKQRELEEEEALQRQEEEKTQQEEQEKINKEAEEKVKKLLPKEDQPLEDKFEQIAKETKKAKEIEEAVKAYDPFEAMAKKIEPPKAEPLIDKSIEKTVDESKKLKEEFDKKEKKATPKASEKEKEEAKKEAIKAGVPEDVAELAAPLDATEIGAAIKAGFLKSTSGIVAKTIYGVVEDLPKKDKDWLEHIAELAGEVVGDIPAFAAGSAMGSAAGGALGGAIGSIIPGVGTAAGGVVGGILGAAAGAMALPTFVKESYREYQDYVKEGGEASFGDFIKAAGRVGAETGKSGLVGALFGGVSSQLAKAMPFISKIKHIDKILNTKPGRYIVTKGLEVGALTASEAIVHRELPGLRQVLDNIAVIFGMDLGHRLAGKAKAYAGRPLVEPIKTREQRAAETKRYESYKKIVEKVLPERVIDVLEGTGIIPESPEIKAKRAPLEERLKEYVGEKNAKMIGSKIDWENAKKTYEAKGEKFTPKVLNDMTYYYQKTGNPKYANDTYKDVLKRMPENAKKFMNEVVKPHLDKSLKAWNEHTETANINPRKWVEERYLPGMYERPKTKKQREALRKIKTTFKLKNPMANQKVFENYNQAAIEGGLKPLFDNPIDLMKKFDEINIKLMANADLVGEIKELQKTSGDQMVVTGENPEAYEKALDKGFVEFQDPFLSAYKKHGKWVERPKPALVDPTFADVFKGVFTKEAFRPDSTFWKVADQIKTEMNYASTLNSFFHGIAETESAIGAKGFGAFRMHNIQEKGRALRANKEVMMDAVKHGLTVKGPQELEIARRKGAAYLGQTYDALAGADPTKGLKAAKKLADFTFDELIPNLKITTYVDTVAQETARYEKKYGRKLTPQEKTNL